MNIDFNVVEKLSNGFLKLFKAKVVQEVSKEKTVEYYREFIVRADAVAILVRDPNTDLLLFTSQFRPGAAFHNESPFVLDIVAGMIDKNETPLEAVLREAKEETGVQNISNVVQISPAFYTSVGGSTEKVTVFYGEADLSDLPKTLGSEDEDEYIEIIKHPASLAINNIENYNTCVSVIALQWLKAEREKRS